MYTWIENTFGFSDGLARGLVFAMALAVVLALFALFVFIIKWLAGARNPSVRSRQPRLAIMDSASVDTRRRLVLVRRDNIEHLILIGGPSDVVVEQGIVRGTPLAAGHVRQQPHLTNGNAQMPNMDGMAASVSAPVAAPAGAPYPEPAAPVSSPAVATGPVEVPQRSAPTPSAPATSAPVPASPQPTPSQAPVSPAPASPAAEAAPQAPAARAAASSGSATVSSLRSRLGDLTRSTDSSAAKPQTPSSREQTSRTGAAASAFSRTLSAIKPQETGKKEEARAPGQPERREPQPPQAAATTAPAAPAPQPPRAADRPAAPASSGETPATGFARTLAKPLQNRPTAPRPVGLTRAVTPPSSGPAAKALTAFPKGPLEERKEPVMDAEPAQAAENTPEARVSPPQQGSETKPADPPVKTEAPAVETPAAPAQPAEVKSEPASSPTPSDEVSPEAPALEQPAAPEEVDKPDPTREANKSVDAATETAATEKAKTNAPAAAEDASSVQSSAAEETVSAEARPEAETGGEPTPSAGTAADDGKTPAELQTAEAQTAEAETKAADQDTKAEDKTPENGQPSPDAGANPIEDEMAKLLDEIHGNQKA